MCKLMEEAGANSFHVRLGPTSQHVCEFASDLYFTGYGIDGTTSYGTQFDFSRHWEGKIIGNHSGCGMMLDVAAEIKEAVNVPVGTVTYMDPAHAPDFFENALKDGKADFLIMNRPLTVDPEYVTKLKEGRLDEIAPCTRCMLAISTLTKRATPTSTAASMHVPSMHSVKACPKDSTSPLQKRQKTSWSLAPVRQAWKPHALQPCAATT